MEHSLQEIRELLKSGQAEQALELCRETVAEKSTSVGHWAYMGAALSTLNRHDEALGALKRACDLCPTKAALWFNLGIAHEKAGMSAEALADYKKAAEVEPAYEPSHAAVIRLTDAISAAQILDEQPAYSAPVIEETAQPELLPETLSDDSQGAYCEAQPCAPVWEVPEPVAEPPVEAEAPTAYTEIPQPIAEPPVEAELPTAYTELPQPIAETAEPVAASAPAPGPKGESLIFGMPAQKAYLYGGIALLAIVVVALAWLLVFNRPTPQVAAPPPMMPQQPMPNPMPMPTPDRPAPAKKSEAPAKNVNRTAGDKVVYITFDGGPSEGFTSKVLPILKRHNCPATFFVVGQYMKRDKTSLPALVKAGHQIENHTDTHPRLSKLDDASIRRDIRMASAEIMRQTGQQPTLVRPPYGDHNARVDAVIRNMGYEVSMWNATCPDFSIDNPDQVVHSLMKQVRPGSVILMHVTRSAWRALPNLLAELDKNGYKYAPLRTNPTYTAKRKSSQKIAETSLQHPIL